jgi:hypothetical protein
MNNFLKMKIKDFPLKVIIIAIIYILFYSYSLFAQYGEFAISSGLSTFRILGNGPNVQSMAGRDSSRKYVGSSFSGVQPGFSVKANFNIDKEDVFNIPVDFNWYYLDGGEVIPVTAYTTVTYHNKLHIGSLSVGLNWNMFKVPVANTKFYTGLEFVTTYIKQGELSQSIEYRELNTVDLQIVKTKTSALRLGALFKVGFVGEILSPWFLDASVGFGAINLLCRNDSRGELLTPFTYYESKESILYNMNFQLLIKYKFK